MTSMISPEDEAIREASPALWAALSTRGRRVQQPAQFLPLQTAQARGTTFNATIGQITDGHGRAVPLPTMAAALDGLSGLDDAARSQAFLYSPVEGLADLRRAWHERQGHAVPSSLPLVTVSGEQARALLGDLFVEEGRIVVVPEPVRPSDRDLFQLRLGARLRSSLEGLPEGEPVLAILDGRPPGEGEREALLLAAGRGPVVAVVDDLFPGLVGLHEDLVPIRVESAGVGFLTFPFPPESAVADALEKKVKMLLRAQVGSPPAAMQVMLLESLRGQIPL